VERLNGISDGLRRKVTDILMVGGRIRGRFLSYSIFPLTKIFNRN
jgi:hypothetical protein